MTCRMTDNRLKSFKIQLDKTTKSDSATEIVLLGLQDAKS